MSDQAPMRVRVVEDSPLMAELVGMVLSTRGIESVHTSGLFHTLLRPEPWCGVTTAVVDLDLGDPDVAGTDVLAYLKEQHPSVRRVVLSATVAAQDASPELHALADVVLMKPCGIDDLLTALQ